MLKKFKKKPNEKNLPSCYSMWISAQIQPVMATLSVAVMVDWDGPGGGA